MLIMFTSVIAGATFAAIFSGYLVQKIPFTCLQHRGLPLSVYLRRRLLLHQAERPYQSQDPHDRDHRGLHIPPLSHDQGLPPAVVQGPRAVRRRRGGPRLPAQDLTGLVLPELGSYLARLGVIAVFSAPTAFP